MDFAPFSIYMHELDKNGMLVFLLTFNSNTYHVLLFNLFPIIFVGFEDKIKIDYVRRVF